MSTRFINVRGCNGSGKTTLLRSLARDPLNEVYNVRVRHDVSAKDGSGKVYEEHAPIPVTYVPGGLALLGDYSMEAKGTTAGCDRIKTQEATKNALELVGASDDIKAVMFIIIIRKI